MMTSSNQGMLFKIKTRGFKFGTRGHQGNLILINLILTGSVKYSPEKNKVT